MPTYEVNDDFKLKGDSLYTDELDGLRSVHVHSVTIDGRRPQRFATVKHDGPWAVYTDSALPRVLSRWLRQNTRLRNTTLRWTEQGMQRDGQAHMIVQDHW